MTSLDPSASSSRASKDPQALYALIAQRLPTFPCFRDVQRVKATPESLVALVAKAYEADDLTEEQDLVWEAVLHVFGLSADLDLARCLKTLADEDYRPFMRMLDEVRASTR